MAGPVRHPPKAGTLQLKRECSKARNSGSNSGAVHDGPSDDGHGAVPEASTYTPAL